jgi:hypothetical protein
MQGKTLTAVFPRLTVTNLSVSGSVSRHHLEDQVLPLPVQSADLSGIVVITTGGNDIIHSYGRAPPRECAMYGATLAQAEPWIRNFRQRLDEMMTTIRGRFPGGCAVFLANIYDPTDGTGDPGTSGLPEWPDGLEILGRYNTIIADCAARHDHVHLVDIRSPFLGHGIHCTKPWLPHYRWRDPTYWYHVNIEDPSDRGYDAIRRLFLLEMIRVLAGGSFPG